MQKETFKVDIDIVVNPYITGWTFEIDFTDEDHALFLNEVEAWDGVPVNSGRDFEVNPEIYDFIDNAATDCLKKILIKENDPLAECEDVGAQWEWIG